MRQRTERLCTPRVAATIATSSSEDNEGPDEVHFNVEWWTVEFSDELREC